MSKLIIRVIFFLSILGLGFASLNLHSLNKLTGVMTLTNELYDNAEDNPKKVELMNRIESEMQEYDELNKVSIVLDASILLLLFGFYISTRRPKAN